MRSYWTESLAGQELKAYALGYYYGRGEGAHNDPFTDNCWLQRLFKMGYDAGVSDYCAEVHSEEVNT